MTQDIISRRGLLQGATLTLGAAALLQQTFRPTAAQAQSGDLPPGTLHSFATGGVNRLKGPDANGGDIKTHVLVWLGDFHNGEFTAT